MTDDKLVLNPFLEISSSDPTRFVVVHAPIRDRGLLSSKITAERDPVLFELLGALVRAGGDLECEVEPGTMSSLHRIGLLVRPDEIFAWPRYRVALKPEAHALPMRSREQCVEPARKPAIDPSSPLWVSSSFLFQMEFQFPLGIPWPSDFKEEGLLSCFAEGPLFWVEQPSGTGIKTPFWVEQEDVDFVASLAPGKPAPMLPAALRASLLSAGALVTSPDMPLAQRAPGQPSSDWRREGHPLIVRDLLHPAELAALRTYFAALVSAGMTIEGPDPLENLSVANNEIVSRFVQARLARFISEAAGEPVKSAFTFFSQYRGGAVLKPHRDGEQAQYSMSLQVDYLPEPPGETGWPLRFLLGDDSAVAADLRMGDAVLYTGRDTTHFRDQLPADHVSTHLILEYVPEAFSGILD